MENKEKIELISKKVRKHAMRWCRTRCRTIFLFPRFWRLGVPEFDTEYQALKANKIRYTLEGEGVHFHVVLSHARAWEQLPFSAKLKFFLYRLFLI